MIASEYGWSMDTILNLPCDITPQLMHAILWRKGIDTTLEANRPAEGTLWEKMQAMKVDTNA